MLHSKNTLHTQTEAYELARGIEAAFTLSHAGSRSSSAQNPATARSLAQRAVRDSPTSSAAWTLLAAACYREGE